MIFSYNYSDYIYLLKHHGGILLQEVVVPTKLNFFLIFKIIAFFNNVYFIKYPENPIYQHVLMVQTISVC